MIYRAGNRFNEENYFLTEIDTSVPDCEVTGFLDGVPVSFFGECEADSIFGGNLDWNQLVGNLVESTQTLGGITFTINSDNSITVTGTATEIIGFDVFTITNIPIDHVCYISSDAVGSEWNKYVTLYDYNERDAFSINPAFIYKKSNSTDARLRTMIWSDQTVNYTIIPQFIDLNKLFGDTIANYIYALEQLTTGAGVELVKTLFAPDAYYKYTSGETRKIVLRKTE